MRATVYIPTFNGRDLVLSALAALQRQTVPAGVVVVENGSSDGTSAAIRRTFPDVTLLEFGHNAGFGGALNRAVRARPAELLVFLNNDAEPEPRFVEALIDRLHAGTETVAGVLLDARRPALIDSAGIIVDKTLLAFDYLHGEPVESAWDAPAPLGATGGAMMIRRETFERLRGFDERIFAYLEDVDLALRAAAVEARCELAPDARAVHRHSATLGSGSARKDALMGWSRGYLLRRYGVLRVPKTAARALVTEATICAGQLLLDRTASGIGGRVRGWRAASGLPRIPVPDDAAVEISAIEALARRARRRDVARPIGYGRRPRTR